MTERDFGTFSHAYTILLNLCVFSLACLFARTYSTHMTDRQYSLTLTSPDGSVVVEHGLSLSEATEDLAWQRAHGWGVVLSWTVRSADGFSWVASEALS